MPTNYLLFRNYSCKIGHLLFLQLCRHNRRRPSEGKIWRKLKLVAQPLLNHVIFKMDAAMDMHEANSCVRGFHVYSNIWTLFVGETLACEQESGNANDPYAVAIKKGSEAVGHVPRKSSAASCYFCCLGGTIYCEITDDQQLYSSDLPQGGLEIPCKFIFRGDTKSVAKVRKLIQLVPPVNVKHDRSKPINIINEVLKKSVMTVHRLIKYLGKMWL